MHVYILYMSTKQELGFGKIMYIYVYILYKDMYTIYT